jgi:hypothetical protein
VRKAADTLRIGIRIKSAHLGRIGALMRVSP